MASPDATVGHLPRLRPHPDLARVASTTGVCIQVTSEIIEEDAPKKKHSGPRKRRPKKKKPDDSKPDDAPVSPSITPMRHHTPPPIDTSPSCSTASDTTEMKAPLRASFIPVSPTQSDSALGGFALVPSQFSLAAPPPFPVVSFYGNLIRSPVLRPPHSLHLSEYGGEAESHDRAYWTQYVIDAAEKERARRLNVLQQLQQEEEEEIRRRRAWAIAAIEQEQQEMMREMFLDNMKNTQWFQNTISRLDHDYEVVCPNSWFGCTFSCMLKDLELHLENCVYRQVPDTLDQVGDQSMSIDLYSYDVVCPNAMLGCSAIFPREELAEHLKQCPLTAMTREKEWEERQEWQQNVIEMTEEERLRRMNEPPSEHDHDRFSFGHLQRLYEEQTAMMHVVLHEEITSFSAQCDAEAERKRPAIERAIQQISQEIRNLWGDEVRVESYGSFAAQLHGGHSDVDLVVFGAAVSPTKDASASQQCVSQLAAHFSRDDLKAKYSDANAITRASIPLVKVVVTVEMEREDQAAEAVKIPFDITFDDPNDSIHNGLASATLLTILMEQFYGLRELTLVLKHFLATRGLNDPYVGGLSSYGLVLMILFVLREQGAVLSVKNSRAPLTDEVTATDCGSISRWEAQRIKGRMIAREILNQARARQVALIAAEATAPSPKKRNRAAVWELLARESSAAIKSPAHRSISQSPTGPPQPASSPDQPFLLGKLLMDFLQWYGNDFRHNVEQISVLTPTNMSDAAISSTISVPSSPVMPASSPSLRPPVSSPAATTRHETFLLIQDPLQRDNNVGKTCYRISQVLRDFSDFLSVLTALIVRGSVLSTHAQTPRGGAHPSGRGRTGSVNSQRILTSVFHMKQAPGIPSASRSTGDV